MKPYQILIVEDDPGVSVVLGRALKKAGYRVHTVPNAECGLALLMGGQIHAALIDLNLPGRNGDDLIDEACRLGCDTKMILMTANGSGEAFARVRAAGAWSIVCKTEDFLTNVRSALSNALGRPPSRPVRDPTGPEYFIQDGQGVVHGPVSFHVIQDLLDTGSLTGWDMVSQSGGPWQTPREVRLPSADVDPIVIIEHLR